MLMLSFRYAKRTDIHHFSRIPRVKRGISQQYLQYPRTDHFGTYSANAKLMSCQVFNLGDHLSGHIRTKSADFALNRTWVYFIASQCMSIHSI